MATKPTGLFPKPVMNFTAGRYLPASKNAAAQPSMFQRSDPYAKNIPGKLGSSIVAGLQVKPYTPAPVGPAQPVNPAQTTAAPTTRRLTPLDRYLLAVNTPGTPEYDQYKASSAPQRAPRSTLPGGQPPENDPNWNPARTSRDQYLYFQREEDAVENATRGGFNTMQGQPGEVLPYRPGSEYAYLNPTLDQMSALARWAAADPGTRGPRPSVDPTMAVGKVWNVGQEGTLGSPVLGAPADLWATGPTPYQTGLPALSGLGTGGDFQPGVAEARLMSGVLSTQQPGRYNTAPGARAPGDTPYLMNPPSPWDPYGGTGDRPLGGGIPPVGTPEYDAWKAAGGTHPVPGRWPIPIQQTPEGPPGGSESKPSPKEDKNNPLAEAAKLLNGAVQGNPFIDAAGKKALQAGRLPLFNQINPAFYRYTSPVILQALQGLWQSGGIRPEEQEFFANIFRPAGF